MPALLRLTRVLPAGRRRVTAIGAVVAVVAGVVTAVAATGTAGAAVTPSALAFTTQPGDGAPGTALAAQPVVTTTDANGAKVASNATVTLTLTGPNGGALPRTASLGCTAKSLAASDGVATFAACKVDRGGVFTLTAVDTVDNLKVVSASFFVSGPAALTFSTAPGGGTAGAVWARQPEVTVVDGKGATVPGATGAIALGVTAGTGAAGAALTCTNRSVTPTSGVATFAGCKVDRSATGYTLTAVDATNLLSATSAAFTVTSGPAAALAFTTPPTDTAGGAAFPRSPVVTVRDAAGNTAVGNTDQVTLALAAGTGTAGATLTCAAVRAVDGVATFPACSVDRAGRDYVLVATDSASGLTVRSAPFAVGSGDATGLRFTTQPGGGSGGAAFATQPAVALTDAGGNAVPGAVSLSIVAGTGAAGATLTCAANPTAAVAGPAAFAGCAVSTTGTGYKLRATSGALTADSAAFDVAAGGVDHLAFQTSPGDGTGGTALSTQPVVAVGDAGGNPAAGTVTLAIAEGTGTPGATLTCPDGPTASSGGLATFAGCSVDRTGTGYRLVATSGTARVQSAPFDVSVGPVSRLAFTTSPGGGTGGTAWSTQPTVTVQDAGGNTVATATPTIDLAVVDGTGSGALTCTATSLPAVRGVARFAGCAIDRTASAYRVRASAGGRTVTSEPFAVAAGPVAALVFSGQPGGSTAGTAAAAQPAVTAVDAGGNPVAAPGPVTLALTAGTGAGGTLACAANPLGAAPTAAFSNCRVSGAGGGYTLTATSGTLRVESAPFDVLLASQVPLGVAPTGVAPGQTFGGRGVAVNPTTVADGVNTGTGALTTSASDLTVAGIGVPFQLVRTYTSADTTGGVFGPGWTSLFDANVTVAADRRTATVRDVDGQQVVFTARLGLGGVAGWVAPPSARASLTCLLVSCTVTRYDGSSFTTTNGRVTSLSAVSGQGLRLAWFRDKVVVTLTTTARTPVVVTASLDTTGRITAVASATRRVAYAYTGGLLTGVTDVRGNRTTLAYTGGRLSQVTDPLGHARLTASYDAGGRVVATTQPGSTRHVDTTFDWSPGVSRRHPLVAVQGTAQRVTAVDEYSGLALVRQTNEVGAIRRYSYDARANLVAVQDPAGWVQQLSYDAGDNLVKTVSPLSSTTAVVETSSYDGAHRPLTRTDAGGNTTRYQYIGNTLLGFVAPPGVPLGQGSKLRYDLLGQLVELTDPIGREVYRYDAAGNRTSVQRFDQRGTPQNGNGTLATFDEAGNQLTSVDPRGNLATVDPAFRTTWTYDAAGNRTSQALPGKGTTTTAYDAAGTVTSVTDPSGTTSYAWDEASLTLTTTAPSGTTTQTFDASGHLLAQTAAATKRSTVHQYDAAGREIATTDPAGVTSSYTYDVDSQVTRAADTQGNEVLTQFDALDRPVRTVENGVTTKRSSYDALGHETASYDAAGALTRTTYDAHGMITSVATAAGTITHRYDPTSDLLLQTVDAKGGSTTFTYDGAGRRTSQSRAGQTTTYGYDAAGNVIRTTDPDARTTVTTYDAADHVTRKVSSQPGQPSVTVQQSFDAAGRRTQLVDAEGTHTYGYDARGNLVRADVAGGTFAYDYGTPGQVRETYPDGTVLTYALDDSGNLMSVETGAAGTASHVKASYVRDADRRATAIAFSNGVLESRTYDAAGRVLDQQRRNGTGALSDDTFTYDGQGNRLSQRSTALGTTTANRYGYDATGRLTSFQTASGPGTLTGGIAPTPAVTAPASPGDDETTVAGDADVTPAFGVSTAVDPATGRLTTLRYDGAGNRLSSTTGGATTAASYDAADRQATATGPGAVVTRYDRAGNVTQLGATTFTYDAAARLASATTAGKTVTYTYDGDGNRTSKTVGGATTRFVWDAFGDLPQLALERTGGGDLVRRYVNGDGPVAMQTPGATFFFHLDPVGSVDGLTDASGALVASYSYDGFGNVTTSGANPPANPLLFQGQYRDADTGLYYMRARWYDPRSGRFTQRDPLERQIGRPGESAYVFAANNPTVNTDPTGQTEVPAAVYGGHRDEATNATATAKLGTTGLTLGVKAVAKFGGYAAAAQKAAASGAGTAAQGASRAAQIGKGLAVAAKGLAIAGIALQLAVAVSDCLEPDVSRCVGAVVGVAVNIGFTILCSFVTSGVGSAACAIAGAVIGIGLQYVITEFGPDIAAGFVVGATWLADGVVSVASDVAVALSDAYDAASTFVTEVGGAIVAGLSEATTAIASGFDDALRTLTDAGYAAAELADVLAHTFEQGFDDAVAGLVGLGYSIADIAESAAEVFSAAADEVASALRQGFAYTALQVAGAIAQVYDLAAAETAKVLQEVGYAVDEVAGVLSSTYHLVAAQAAAVLDEIGYGFGQVAGALQTVFAQTDAAVAGLLKQVGALGTEVATALRDFYGDLDDAAAAALDAAAYTVDQIAGALKSAYATTAAAVVGILDDLGATAVSIAGALQSTYAVVATQAALLLKEVGFVVTDVADALVSAYSTAANATATALRAVGYAVTEVAQALETTFSQAAAAAAGVLRDIGYGAVAIGEALKTTFDQAAAGAAAVLQGIGYGVGEVTGALRDAFTLAAAQAADALRSVFSVNAVAGALSTVYAQSAQQVAQIFRGLGYAASEIASVLRDAFGQAAATVAGVLKAIGVGAAEIASTLQNTFNQAVADVANVLSSIGFNNDTINAIGGAFASFGQDVADCFTSFFTDC
ncbi:RHS repeat-associated core domain-containing protein [Jatrophihabitans sp. YIM 134969]